MNSKLIKILAMVISLVMVASTVSGCGKETTDNKDNENANSLNNKFLVDSEEYRGTSVTYVTWKDPEKNEDGPVIEAFEQKYGIDVNIQLVDQGTYLSTIAASIASNQQGDIFFENGTFPGSLSVMQPLDNAMLNLNDPIWNQATIKASTLDGHPYLVDTISNVWAEVDICVYNKKIFEDNNITSPAEYYEAGKWTFEAFKECAKQVSALGKEYVGAELLGEPALGAAGCSIFTYKDNKMITTVDEHLYEVMNYLSQMNSDGYVRFGRTGFTDGKVGMALTNCFALKKTGYFTTINPEHLGATYLPTWKEGEENKVTGIYRGWGLIKGAKNPVAAGLFLREYLDVNNYDLSKTFHSQEVSDFFFQVTGTAAENILYYHGPDMVTTTGMGEAYHEYWATFSPSQIRGRIESNLNVMNSMCDKANEIIETERKWLKENYK